MKFGGKIGIVGAGALGAFYGARLYRAGNDVHFLVRTGFELIREHGYEIRSCDGDFTIKPPVYSAPEDLGKCDLILVGLKAFANHFLPEVLGPLATSNTVVVTLQNGLGNEETIAEALVKCGVHRSVAEASKQIIGGTAFLCSNRVAPNVIIHSAHGFVRLAEFQGSPKERTFAVAQLFLDAGISCEVRESLAAIRWEKLVWNIPFNGLGVAAHQADTAVILADPELRTTAVEIMKEVIAAAKVNGVDLDECLVADLIGKTEIMGHYKSSMQIDFEAGRPLEVEAILGEPVRRAQQKGFSAPRMHMLYALVRRMDQLRQSNLENSQPRSS